VRPIVKSIYLYKPPDGEDLTDNWVYYRVGSVSLEEPAGRSGAPIQVCRVSWPTFEDILPMTDTTGITGLATAGEQVATLVKGEWGVEHAKSCLIGIIIRHDVRN
jgi:hypothetical protein